MNVGFFINKKKCWKKNKTITEGKNYALNRTFPV